MNEREHPQQAIRGLIKLLAMNDMEYQYAKGILTETYFHFNNRDIDATLSKMDIEVDWPNGMEGG